jgi:cell volume regulation protein A
LSLSAGERELAVLAVVALAGLLLGRGSERVGVPDVVVFLLAGVAANLAGWRPFASTDQLGQAVTVLAAAYILHQGGESLDLDALRPVWLSVVLLATLGVLVTMAVVGAAAAWLLAAPTTLGLLVGAVLAATDPAVLIPIYQGLRVSPRVAQVVMSESALNDATGAICASVMAAVVMGQAPSAPAAGLAFFRLVGIGIVAGLIAGVVNVLLVADGTGFLRRHGGVLALPVAVLAYAGATLLGGSGLMAAFTAGVVVRNHAVLPVAVSELTREMSREYARGTSVVVRALIFIGLGANLDLAGLARVAGPGLLVVAVLVLVARPLAVLASTLPDRGARWTWRELALFGWARETGVVPGALSVVLLSEGVPGARVVAAVTGLAILVTVLVQGTTTPWLARRLRLTPTRPPLPASP